MAPKRSTKAALKKKGTMASTAAAGQEFLKQAWGQEKLNQVNALLQARDNSDSSSDEETTTPAKKPKLSKTATMKATTKEAKVLLGKQVLGDTRSDTKRRQAAVNAKKALEEVTKSTSGRKPALKRAGTMAKTAKEGKAYIQRTAGNKKTTGRTRTGGRTKKSSK